MLSTLLTPLRAKFDLSPRTPNLPVPPVQEDDLSPEDFARDVLIELMRNSVHNLTEAETLKARTEVLSEIHRIMLQDGRTKDVFRELDGFLVLMSALAAMGTPHAQGPIVEPPEQVLADTLECTRLAFMVLSEAMYQHSENADYFNVSVGYDSLSSALSPLISDPKTAHESLGFLLSLSLNNFTLSGVFVASKHADPKELDSKVSDFQTRLSTIVHAGAIHILWKYLPDVTSPDSPVYYSTLKLFDALTVRSHRNQAVFSTVDFVSALVDRFCEVKGDENKKRRSIVQKLLRRFMDMGAATTEAKKILQRAIKEDGTLDMEIMELIRGAMKSRWLDHFSLESPAALSLTQDGTKGLPSTGFTFMMWLWISKLPEGTDHRMFVVRSGATDMVLLKLRCDGKLVLQTSSSSSPVIFSKLAFAKSRWIHLALVHYPGRDRSSNPTIRLFIDGVLNDHINWSYPKPIPGSSSVQYIIGDDATDAKLSWCIASSYFLSVPLADDLPRLIHHLGPRYFGNFQDPALIKFFTYEASTSLSMFLSTVAAASPGTSATTLTISKVLRDGLGISESNIIFALSPLNMQTFGSVTSVPVNGSRTGATKEFTVKGDVYMVKVECLDMALWKIGGISVALRLVQVANTAHEVSRALSVLTDGLKNNWQNSEDMERLRGYEVLADILRSKTSLINMTSFETIFEFLGINFRSPDHSTITNVVAYKCLALDFELWSHTRLEIQRVHFEHLITLLETSRYKKFNIKQRFAKIGLVRRLLFVLQTDWYQGESLGFLLDAFKVAMNALWTKDETIKPIVSFLAANLQEDLSNGSSPKSIMSRIDHLGGREKAEKVLEFLVSTVSVPSQHVKFSAALPINRIILLLLGDRPSPFVAKQCLILVRISVGSTSSFIRKFEMISGWNVLKTVLPTCWDLEVNEAAFDLLLRPFDDKGGEEGNIVCPQIVPTILAALHSGLNVVARNSSAKGQVPATFTTEATMESLVEKLMNLHARSGAFRHVFQSQQTTQLFVNAYKDFVAKISGESALNDYTVRILEKLAHLGLALALDNSVAGAQKREILGTLQTAETVLNPSAESTQIDPNLVADTRSVRQRFASARFSLQIGERTVMKIITRIIEWRKTIQVSERKRLRKNILDLRENRRQVSRLYEWTYRLTSERGLWCDNEPVHWRLDETEGPQRIRKRMEPANPRITIQYVEGQQQPLRGVQIPDSEVSSAIVQTEVPPWADSYEIASTEMEDRQLVEEITEDKHRKVRHELEPGDVIEAVQTVARISGVDSSPGLLIIGRTHLYMLDGLVEGEDGEVIDAHEAPKQLFFVPGSIVELDGPQRAQRWSHEQVATCSDKTFLFRDVALEVYFKDSRSLLIVFLDKNKRLDVHHRLTAITSRLAEAPTPGLLRTPLFGRVSAGARVLSGLWNDELSTAQRRWQAREISNFAYLSILNQISGRTPSDATQYPVFPWVLQDYQSQTLDLTDPKSYRDLTKPMGALTDARREAAEVRYSNLISVDEKPFHYGTHYSSSMIVCHFLIRMAPFTNMFKTLQGGDWDLPDRLFSDISRAYESAARDIRGDVRELIPEFFHCPEFLENYANLDFGVQQNTGEKIHDVKLPPWARDDPLLFVIMNRKALESSFVSEHLPAWIDLIWGCKQNDPESVNVYHPLSYEGAIDLSTITDELEREATIGIIHNFGQTPRRLFTTPHPQRYNHGLSTLPIGTLHGIEEDFHLLVQGSRCFQDLGSSSPVRQLSLDVIGEKIIPCPEGVLVVPSHPHEQIEWGARTGGELRVVVDQKVTQIIEGTLCTCAAFPDANNLVTGSSDHIVRLWSLTRGHLSSPALALTVSHHMRVHTDRVVSVAASRPWSVVVSGSEDGSAAIWDLNRAVYVRSIWHDTTGDKSAAVHLIDINESTGYIATCSKLKLCLHTINARPIATLDLTMMPSSSLYPPITAISFHEREYSHLGVLATASSDGTITLRTWTADGTPEGQKAKWEFITMRIMKVKTPTGKGGSRTPAVTALKFIGESLCHGEDSGKSYMWSLPD